MNADNCYKCNRELCVADSISCKFCRHRFHYQCLNLTPKECSKLRTQANSWICPGCINVTSRNKKSNITGGMKVPCNVGSNPYGADLCIASKSPSSPSPTSDCPVTMENISSLLDDRLFACMASFSDRLREDLCKDLKAFITSEINVVKSEFTETTDYLASEQRDIKAELSTNSDYIKSLEAANVRLQNDLVTLENRLSAAEKLSRSRNLEIQAVPEKRSENVILMAKKLFETIGVTLNESDLQACRRVAKMNSKTNRPRNILVSLSSPILRDQILSAVSRFNRASSNNFLNSSHLGVLGEPQRIYVAEHLSPECKTVCCGKENCKGEEIQLCVD